MTQATIGPVTAQERIQTIDIIRGFALLGILIINFTVDSAYIDPGFDGLGDQLAYWSIRLFMDDRFMTIYCFLFGLGFAIQIQRAAARNSFFGFIFLRRLIALYLIGFAVFTLTDEGNVLIDYAMVGVLLLFFWKVSVRFLPILAIFFFLLPLTRNIIVEAKAELTTQTLQHTVKVDTTVLDEYVGVYERTPEHWTVIIREGTELYGIGRLGNKIHLYPNSETEFYVNLQNKNLTQIFIKDSSGKIEKFILQENGQVLMSLKKIQESIKEGLKRLKEQRAILAKSDQKRLSYLDFIEKNAVSQWYKIKNWSWQDFLWGNKIGYILVLFLLGMYAGKRKIFHDVEANRMLLKKIIKWGLIIGGTGVAFSTGFDAWDHIKNIEWNSYSGVTRILIRLPWNLGIIFMAMAYIAGLTLLVQNKVWEKRLSFMAIVGRLGLTNYILHCFAFMFVFDKVSWFWGLEDKIGTLYRLLLAIPVYALLYFFSLWWLKHFKHGPFEWLWRSLTYLKFQPMKLKKSNENNKAETMNL